MRGNIGALLVVMCAAVAIIGVAFGAHLYRWEMIVWPSVAAVFAAITYVNSRQ